MDEAGGCGDALPTSLQGRAALLLGVLSVDTLQLSAPAVIASAAESGLAQGQDQGVLEAAHSMADQDGGRKACSPWASLRHSHSHMF